MSACLRDKRLLKGRRVKYQNAASGEVNKERVVICLSVKGRDSSSVKQFQPEFVTFFQGSLGTIGFLATKEFQLGIKCTKMSRHTQRYKRKRHDAWAVFRMFVP